MKYFVLALFVLWSIVTKPQSVNIIRIDRLLYSYLNAPTSENGSKLLNENKEFLEALARTLNISYTDDNDMLLSFQEYFKHPVLYNIYKDTEDHFQDMSPYENELSIMLQHASEIMIIKDTPKFYSHISGLKENIISINDIISVSLDKYLGEDYLFYSKFFPKNELLEMNPSTIVRDYTKGWLMTNYIAPNSNEDLLSNMIYEGKLIYILSKILPNSSDEQLLSCKSQDIDWYRDNQKQIWKQLIRDNNLYSTDKNVINNWMHSSKMPNISGNPGNVGGWIGYQLIKKYMETTGDNINDLIKNSDGVIFKKSKFNP